MKSRRSIGHGVELIETLEENGAILDAEIKELGLFGLASSSLPSAYFCFGAGHRAYDESYLVRLELRHVTRFDFFQDDFVGNRYVERYKFFVTEKGDFYLSIDPYLEGDTVDEERDNWVIRSAEVRGFLIERDDAQRAGQATDFSEDH